MRPIVPGRLMRAASGATFSPWDVSSLPSNVTASEGNFRLTRSGGADGTRGVYHPVARSTGKYAIRLLVLAAGTGTRGPAVGIINGSIGGFLGQGANAAAFWPNSDTSQEYTYKNNVGAIKGTLATFAADTEVMIEVDFTAGKIWFGVAGNWVTDGSNTGNPGAGTFPTYTITTGIAYSLVADMYYGGQVKLLIPSQFTTPASSGFTAGWPD